MRGYLVRRRLGDGEVGDFTDDDGLPFCRFSSLYNRILIDRRGEMSSTADEDEKDEEEEVGDDDRGSLKDFARRCTILLLAAELEGIDLWTS